MSTFCVTGFLHHIYIHCGLNRNQNEEHHKTWKPSDTLNFVQNQRGKGRMEEAEFFPRHAASTAPATGGCFSHPDHLLFASGLPTLTASGGKYSPRDEIRLWWLHLRSRQNVQRLVQIGSGILILLIVFVCVFTLVVTQESRTNNRSGYKTTARLKPMTGESDSGQSSSVMLSRLQNTAVVVVSPPEPVSLSEVFISVKTSAKEGYTYFEHTTCNNIFLLTRLFIFQ
jgi:hypothetical protein